MPEAPKYDEKHESVFKRIFSADKGATSKSNIKILPRDEWGHKTAISGSDELRDVEDMRAMLSKELVLANIDDDFMIMLIEERFGLVILPLFQLYKRTGNESVKDMMNWFFSRTIIGLKLSRSKRGPSGMNENDKQYGRMGGMVRPRGGILDSILNRGRQGGGRQAPPEEEGDYDVGGGDAYG